MESPVLIENENVAGEAEEESAEGGQTKAQSSPEPEEAAPIDNVRELKKASAFLHSILSPL